MNGRSCKMPAPGRSEESIPADSDPVRAGMVPARKETMTRSTRYPSDEPSTAPVDGVASSVKHLLSASARYTSARVRLLMLEARLAAEDTKGALALCLFAAAGMMAGSLLLVVAIVLWVARLFMNGDTALASAVLGVVLLITTLFLLRKSLKSISAQDLFPVTKAEFNVDKQWLQELPRRTPGTNARS